MDLFQLRGSDAVGTAFVGLDVVGEIQFFHEPHYALGAGFFEPGTVSLRAGVLEESVTSAGLFWRLGLHSLWSDK
jgi:hypothetical protein